MLFVTFSWRTLDSHDVFLEVMQHPRDQYEK